MTGGSFLLTVSARAAGVLTPANQPRGASVTLSDGARQSLTYGTSSGMADILVFQTRTLTAGASATYDLYTGTDLKDVIGDTAAFRKLKTVFVWVDSGGDTAGVTIGNAASNGNAFYLGAAAQTTTIFPGGPGYTNGSPAGIAVGATTCNVKILNNGAVSVVVGIALAGTSA